MSRAGNFWTAHEQPDVCKTIPREFALARMDIGVK
jgi:hypothetical protein